MQLNCMFLAVLIEPFTSRGKQLYSAMISFDEPTVHTYAIHQTDKWLKLKDIFSEESVETKTQLNSLRKFDLQQNVNGKMVSLHVCC